MRSRCGVNARLASLSAGILLMAAFCLGFAMPKAAIAETDSTTGTAEQQAVPQAESTWTRFAGADRYDTMQKVVLAGFTSSEYAIVTSGDNFPDSLSGTALAGMLDAPIIMTSSKSESLSPEAKSAIEQLGVKSVIVLGGSGAVSEGTYAELEQMLGSENVQRLSGGSRIATMEAVFDYGAKQSGWGSTLVVSSGSNFPDALSMSAFMYANKSPVLLTDSNGLISNSTVKLVSPYIKSGMFKKAVILGGTNAVGSSVEYQLQGMGIDESSIVRLSGSDRYVTSGNIAEYSAVQSNYDDPAKALSFANVVLASGENFPDALAGGPFAGVKSGITVLVAKSNTDVYTISSTLAAHKSEVQNWYVLGGGASISDSVVDAIKAL